MSLPRIGDAVRASAQVGSVRLRDARCHRSAEPRAVIGVLSGDRYVGDFESGAESRGVAGERPFQFAVRIGPSIGRVEHTSRWQGRRGVVDPSDAVGYVPAVARERYLVIEVGASSVRRGARKRVRAAARIGARPTPRDQQSNQKA